MPAPAAATDAAAIETAPVLGDLEELSFLPVVDSDSPFLTSTLAFTV